jgi:hypothetical protein
MPRRLLHVDVGDGDDVSEMIGAEEADVCAGEVGGQPMPKKLWQVVAASTTADGVLSQYNYYC